MEAILEKPSLRDQKVARASLYNFALAFAKNGPEREGVKIRIQESGTDITVPRKALELLQFILSSMAQGKAVSLIPSDSEVTTQQAADMLNVSRPHLVKLLEQGALPHKKVGSHRRILLEDLLAYEAKQAKIREHQLQLLAEQAQEFNMGYE
ncbi:helix-turn-helix domain-containing protein [Hymenobacter terrenus]|uniref:helix-turn-helix domain-containing protein n=1 Tax=Hymenobacter terrenus TaxID=1629124 RepID=UPI000908136E|nr:helix-turn-helix domain-containing protein [Hymenobacter terrenus]